MGWVVTAVGEPCMLCEEAKARVTLFINCILRQCNNRSVLPLFLFGHILSILLSLPIPSTLISAVVGSFCSSKL